MTGILLLVLIVGLQIGGFGLLALSQARHWQAVRGSSLPRSAMLLMRAAGSTLIALSLPAALRRDGPGFGSVLWVCTISVAAVAVVMMLRLARRLKKMREPSI